MSSVEKSSDSVREMFAAIAPKYDFLNHFLSLSVDRSWRRRLVRRIGDRHRGGWILDVCTGTADLAMELSRCEDVVGVDFCHPMLVIARDKVRGWKGSGRVTLAEADALCLPFSSGAFNTVTVAFGVRNLERLQDGLKEFARVLRPGGSLAILEFSTPAVPLLRQVFQFYFHHVLPVLGRIISGVDGPYRYLPASVREFPDQEGLGRVLSQCGFEDVCVENLSGGIAALHIARKRRD